MGATGMTILFLLAIFVIAGIKVFIFDERKRCNTEERLASFYEECVRNGYTKMSDATQRAKAGEIAKRRGLRFRSVWSIFTKAKEAYENAERKKVDGTLFMTVYDYLQGENTGKRIAFYRRPDKSIYYKENGGVKQEGRPTFSVENAHTVFYNYHEGKVVYTGATVGGITTGGFHTEKPYMSEHKQYTGKGEIVLSYNGKRLEAKRVTFSSDMATKFRNEMGSSMYGVSVKGKDFLLVKSSIQDRENWKGLMNTFTNTGMYNRAEQYSNAKVDTLYDKELCRKIIEAINRTLL